MDNFYNDVKYINVEYSLKGVPRQVLITRQVKFHYICTSFFPFSHLAHSANSSHNHQLLLLQYSKESPMELAEANSNQNMDNFFDDDTEAEDTLSLCDYSITTIAAKKDGEDQENYSRQVLQSSSSTSSSGSDQENYFEFCSEEWSTSSASYPPENIIFCGKIIAYGEPSSQIDFQNLAVKETGLIKKPVESFRWNGSHNISASSRKEEQKLHKTSSVGKISVLNSLGKFRWSLFLFGGTRFLPTEMALRDIKNRQSRRSSSSSSTLFGLKSDHDEKIRKNRSPQGLFGLLKAIGGGGQHHANNVVKASIGCFPRL